MTEDAISLIGIEKRINDLVILDHIDLSIGHGSLTALVGPSGSGKSTLLRILAGLDSPTSGTVMMNGRDVGKLSARDRKIGFVFQHYAPFKHMTVEENIAFGLKIQKRSKEEIEEKVEYFLKVVGMPGLQKRYPHQLSGGQRQRMALARTLAVDPQILLLDEPFGALDARVRDELRSWLRHLHEQVSITTVLVTHDHAEAFEVADRIAVLHQGHIEQYGSCLDVYDNPANSFVMSFFGNVISLNGQLVRPHDILLRRLSPSNPPGPSDVVATVERVIVLGFEVRVELTTAKPDEPASSGDEFFAQISRSEADELNLKHGEQVVVLPRSSRVVKMHEAEKVVFT